MDALLARLGVQAMNYAIRSGIALTSTYAISQCSRLIKTVDDKGFHSELRSLQKLLNSKIKIISPAIDLIEFKSGRGNVFLESAVPLAKSLHREIVALGRRLENAAAVGETSQTAAARSAAATAVHELEVARIIADIKTLLARIDRDIPLLQLAITASGESLSTSLPAGVSPSRLLQASTFLIVGDTQYANNPEHAVQIGPAFTLSLYMLFLGHAAVKPSQPDSSAKGASPRQNGDNGVDPHAPQEDVYGLGEHDRKPLWQEVVHKARVRLCRTQLGTTFDGEKGYVPPSPCTPSQQIAVMGGIDLAGLGRLDEFAYHLEIIEDLADGRVHEEFDTSCRSYDDIPMAGIRESIPIHQFSKIFYTDTGRILNIGNATEGENNPVLLLKRDPKAKLPRPLAERLRQDPIENSFENEDSNSGLESDEQAQIDRQLNGEADHDSSSENVQAPPLGEETFKFPPHLDPEWMALEVFEEDDDEDFDSSDADLNDTSGDDEGEIELSGSLPRPNSTRKRSSLDARLLTQIKNISLLSSPLGRKSASPVPTRADSRQLPLAASTAAAYQEAAFVARSPFGAITSSLSLMEMLIRLTSLQESQQTSHLSIPDHVLTFFLEETSTTGLKSSEDRWKARHEARRRVGFDPYTDTPR